MESGLVPQQIVCVEGRDSRLYGLVIQTIALQGTYWLRPLCLVDETQVIDLHETSDVILAAAFCRPAWDEEVLTFWTALYPTPRHSEDNLLGRSHLHRFLRELLADMS